MFCNCIKSSVIDNTYGEGGIALIIRQLQRYQQVFNNRNSLILR